MVGGNLIKSILTAGLLVGATYKIEQLVNPDKIDLSIDMYHPSLVTIDDTKMNKKELTLNPTNLDDCIYVNYNAHNNKGVAVTRLYINGELHNTSEEINGKREIYGSSLCALVNPKNPKSKFKVGENTIRCESFDKSGKGLETFTKVYIQS